MRGGVFYSEIGFRFDDARAIPRAVVPTGDPRSYKLACDGGGIISEKITRKFFQPKRLRIEP